jgi:GNAT superfamily N-acetyltransferase
MSKANGTDRVEIRLARASEALELARLRYRLRSMDETNEAEDVFVQRCYAWIKDRLGDDSWRCWLAERDGILLGTLWLQLIEKIPNPNPEAEFLAYITSFFVAETVRGQGIGSRLLTQVLGWCKEREVHGVILWPTPRSRSLYERHGFEVPSDLLELLITGPSPGQLHK